MYLYPYCDGYTSAIHPHQDPPDDDDGDSCLLDVTTSKPGRKGNLLSLSEKRRSLPLARSYYCISKPR
jgi:hypothetical protein